MLHPDSTTVRLIHQQMIEDEMARHRKPDREDSGSPTPRPRATMAVRHITARALHAFARWIEPQTRIDQSLPPTTPAV